MSERWDRYFLDMALLSARMSKDPSTQVGAVIVGPDREIISTGFNGFPRGIEDRICRLHDRETKYKLVVHAEMNAVLAAARNGIRLKGCALYLVAASTLHFRDGQGVWGGPPCTRCTVEVIQAGISEIVSFPSEGIPARWKDDVNLSRELLAEAGITYREIGL